ncbi:hypothetical protein WA577_004404 [Blastocystis sp. JDR]
MGIGGMDSLYAMIYENEAPKAEARKLKHKLYKPLQHAYSRSFFNTYLREALLQDGFHFSCASEEEIHNVSQWISVNGPKWREAEVVFGRPKSSLRRMYKQSFSVQREYPYPMEVFCACAVALLKYYPSLLFVIKGRETPTKHIRGDPFQKLPYEGLSRHSSYASMFYLLCHRYWPIEDYHSLFSFLLEHSRQVVLDSAPCAIALRFLSYPVNQLQMPFEYCLRLMFLFVYYIDELSPTITIREFLHFLQERIQPGEDVLELFEFSTIGLRTRALEFDGFVKGNPHKYVDRSEALDEEVFRINEAIIPSDEELRAMIDEANCGGCELIRAAQYSGILPGDMERSEELLDSEEWKKRRERERKHRKREKKSTTQFLELSDSDIPPSEEEKEKKKPSKKKRKTIRHVRGMKV